MQVRLLGAHNLESRATRHTCFLIDGVLAVDAGSLASALAPDEQQRARAVLLTHRHFDHLRDIPTLALATREAPEPIEVYGLPETLEALRAHLVNGSLYPDFTQGWDGAPGKLQLRPLEPGHPLQVLGYEVHAVPVPHSAPALGYVVRAHGGGCMAYSGDTSGQLLPFFSEGLAPQVFFVEVTFPDRLGEAAQRSGHLTPGVLRCELLAALEQGLRVPPVVAVHRDLWRRHEVVQELETLARDLGLELVPGYEDTMLRL